MNVEREKFWIGAFAMWVTLATSASQATAAVALISESGTIYAETTKGSSTDTASVTSVTAPAPVLATLENSVTEVSTTWETMGAGTPTLIYTASGTLKESKAPAAKPGVDHVGRSSITMEFQPDANGNLSFTGSLTDVSMSGADDPFTWSIEGDDGSTLEGTQTAFPVNGEVEGGTTYTLRVDTSMLETINNLETRMRTWETRLTVSSIPEPSTSLLLCAAAVWLTLTRKRK